jgi:transposase
VYKTAGPFGTLRQLVKAHQAVLHDTVRMQSRLKALFRSRGVPVGQQNIYGADRRAEWISQLPPSCRQAATFLYTAYDGLEAQRKAAHKALVTESHQHASSRILETCPGLGPIRVAQVLAIGVCPQRFRTRQQFWAYCGLGIVMRSSADWVQEASGRWVKAMVQQTRGLNWNHNRLLKAVFKGAATTVISHHQDPMVSTYERLCHDGVKPNLAKLTLARKIAATALAMWKQQEVYQPDKSKPKR